MPCRNRSPRYMKYIGMPIKLSTLGRKIAQRLRDIFQSTLRFTDYFALLRQQGWTANMPVFAIGGDNASKLIDIE